MRNATDTGNGNPLQRRVAALWLLLAEHLPPAGLWRRRNADGVRWYQVVYRLIYRSGVIIWRRAAPPDDLVALVEGPTALPAGRALDIGSPGSPHPMPPF